MEKVTTKIIDNTFISAIIKEIKSVDLLSKCLVKYDLITSLEVYKETKEGFDSHTIHKFYEKIKTVKIDNKDFYFSLMEYLKKRYPYLHKGEISTFLIALLNYELKNKNYYYVTDDGGMRKAVSKILKDKMFINLLKTEIIKFNLTGTIGLIKRLYDHKILSDDELSIIIDDLRNSTFYITEDLIDFLRGRHENKN